MLRLTPPGFERLLQSPTLHATFGGGEANVAASLAGFGLPAAFVTILPQANPLADAAIGELRRFGVDTSHIARSAGRMGIYFLETGASQRASKVVYDRAGKRVRAGASASIDWPRVLAGAGWFHVTGITPAVSEAAACSRDRGRAHRTRHGHHGLVRSEFSEEPLEVGQARVRGDARARASYRTSSSRMRKTFRWRSDLRQMSTCTPALSIARATVGLTEAVMREYGHLRADRRDAAGVEERVAQRLVGVPA